MTNRAVVILAAGSSTRLGQPKQDIPYAGKTLLQRSIETAARTGAEVWVTTSATRANGPQDRMRCAAEGPIHSVEAPSTNLDSMRVRTLEVASAAEGMSASLRVAAQTAIQHIGIDHLAVLPVDQYAVDAAWLNALFQLSARYPGRFVASVYDARRGAPAVFPRSHFAELLTLSGDAGARHLLRDAASESIIEWSAPWAPGDIDTKADLAALANRLSPP